MLKIGGIAIFSILLSFFFKDFFHLANVFLFVSFFGYFLVIFCYKIKDRWIHLDTTILLMSWMISCMRPR